MSAVFYLSTKSSYNQYFNIKKRFCQFCRYRTGWPFAFPQGCEITRVPEWSSAVFYLRPVTSSISQSITLPNKSVVKPELRPASPKINGTLRLYQLNLATPSQSSILIDRKFIFLQMYSSRGISCALPYLTSVLLHLYKLHLTWLISMFSHILWSCTKTGPNSTWSERFM